MPASCAYSWSLSDVCGKLQVNGMDLICEVVQGDTLHGVPIIGVPSHLTCPLRPFCRR